MSLTYKIIPAVCMCFMGGASSARAQSVACEKYQLANGMTVILHEDHSLPVACINLWYQVGSKDEQPGRSGFAHLFEHLMFMGTRRVPGSEFDVLMESGGGFNNASTSEDRTNYYSFGPSSLLPTLLWLDADRLEELGKEMTQEKLDKQREIVRNERRQTSEMQPYGRADLKISELMYPPGHPYHNPVIGSHEDLEAATVRDVKDFFARYYVPNNASLVVAGDFDPKFIKPIIENLFGGLPRGAEVVHAKAEPAGLNEVRRVTYTDQVQFPRITMAYHSPAHFQPGDAEMDLAAAVLGKGKSSRLYKRLVYDDKLATDVSASQSSSLLGSLFNVEVTAKEGIPLDKIEAAIDAVLTEFVANGPTAEELERQKATLEYEYVSSLQSLLSKADQLNEYNAAFGDPNSFKRDLDRYRKAAPSDVREWAGKVLTPNARLIMRVLPVSEAGNNTARDTRPGPSVSKPFTPPMPEVFKLSNGIEVRLWNKPELPLVALEMLLRGGACADDPRQSGRTYLTCRMLDEGAGDRGALEFAEALVQLGADFSVDCGQGNTTAGLSVLKDKLDEALSLYADAIVRPRFEEKEWQRVKTLHLEDLRQAEDRPPAVASRVGMRAYFGDQHPYGRPVDGTISSVGALTLDALKERHRQLFQPVAATIFLAGDLTAAEAKKALEKAFGAWKPLRADAPASHIVASKCTLPPPANDKLNVVVVNKPGAVQTVIRFFMPAPAYKDPRRVNLELLNTILGGSFTSRLNQNLRERNGFTYGARSRFNLEPDVGYFTAGADVQAEHTGEALREFLKEFDLLRKEGVSEDEAGKARETNRMDLVQSFQGLGGILAKALELQENGLDFSSLGAEFAAIDAANRESMSPLAAGAVPVEQALIVLVGDKGKIEKQLKGLPLPPPRELDVSGDAAKKDK